MLLFPQTEPTLRLPHSHLPIEGQFMCDGLKNQDPINSLKYDSSPKESLLIKELPPAFQLWKCIESILKQN